MGKLVVGELDWLLRGLVLGEVDYPGIDGFLGTRASVMLDVVVLAMLLVLPLLAVSIFLVKRRQYRLHKWLQLGLASVLLVTVLAFEVDMQWLTKWELRAVESPYFELERKWTSTVGISLLVHLMFAVPTLVLWIYVVVQALRKFDWEPRPGPHSHSHSKWGWLAAVGMLMTAVTGWIFYALAFVAER